MEIFGPPQNYETVNGTLKQNFFAQILSEFDINHYYIIYVAEVMQRKWFHICSEPAQGSLKSHVVFLSVRVEI